MTFENWWRSKYPTDIGEIEFRLLREAWNEATKAEREACAKAIEGFTDETDERSWVPGSFWDTLRNETAAVIRKRSNTELRGGPKARPATERSDLDRRFRMPET